MQLKNGIFGRGRRDELGAHGNVATTSIRHRSNSRTLLTLSLASLSDQETRQ